MTPANYGSSQSVFAILVTTVLDSVQEFLLLFTPYSPRYIQSWIDDRRAELLIAEGLPDEYERTAASEILRVTLAAQNATFCGFWQRLKRYISKAYTGAILEIQLESAGQAYYRAASNENWAKTKKMHVSSKNFMTSNLAALTANDNMPPTFPAEMNAAAALFNITLPLYESSKEAIGVATEAKVRAFNNLHDLIMEVMLDGQVIFKDDEPKRTQFIYGDVLSRISGHGLAGIRGTIFSDADLQPIEDAVVTLTIIINEIATTYTATSDAEGKYVINSPSGDYKLQVTCPGYVPSAIKDVTVIVGTVSTFNEKLVPAPVEEAI